MTTDKSDNGSPPPILNLQPTIGLTDYFCPFCGQKLFRGKVTTFNMVCSNCNKLVKNSDIQAIQELDQKIPDPE